MGSLCLLRYSVLDVTALILCSPFGVPRTEASEWTHVGIGGGGHMCRIDFDPNDTGKIYIGSDVTGLFRTDDDGQSWNASTLGMSDYYIRSVVVHPDDPDLLFVTTGQGVSRSLDGGITWETALEREVTENTKKYAAAFACVTVDPVDSDVIWATIGGFRFSSSAGVGGDTHDEWDHVWRSELLGVPGSWHSIPGPADDEGVHSIVLLPVDSDPSHPGSERFLISSTGGIWRADYFSPTGDWLWESRMGTAPDTLPHGDARDLDAKWTTGGALERLYLVLDSHWDESIPESAASIYDHAAGYGGGVWYSNNEGASWYPTSFVDGSDSLHLEDGYTSADIAYPKNMRHVAVDQDSGYVYLALTERRMSNEGVWKADPSQPDWLWRRITESRTYAPWNVDMNLEIGYYTALGSVDGLAVQPGTGDVIFTTNMQAFRCPRGDCLPGDPSAEIWRSFHSEILPTNPETYSTTGLDVVQAFDMTVAPTDTSVWFLAVSDIGLLRSDDAGVGWRRIGLTDSLPYSAYGGSRTCHKIVPVPESPDSEYVGIFGTWKYPPRFGLWRTLGVPADSTVWDSLEIPVDSLYVEDLILLDSTHMLVGTRSGLYRGIRTGSDWAFEADTAGIPTGRSTRAYRFASASGSGPNRPMVVAFTRWNSINGGIFRRDRFDDPWEEAVYASGPTNGMNNIHAITWSVTDDSVVYGGNASSQFNSAIGGVLRSDDAGATWSMIAQDFGGYDPSCFDVDGLADLDGRIYAGLTPRDGTDYPTCYPETFGGVFFSDDNGESWTPAMDGLDAGHIEFLRRDETNPERLFCGTFGNGAYIYYDGTATGVTSPDYLSSAESSSPIAAAVPTPFLANTNIFFRLPTSARVTLRIYDVAGRVVRTLLENDLHSAGTAQIVWDGRTNAGRRAGAGTYFYKLELPGRNLTGKTVLLR